MRRFDYKTQDLEMVHKANNGAFLSDACIVNAIISNDISKDWDYTKGKVICFGVLQGPILTIYLADDDDDKSFYDAVREKLKSIKLSIKPKSFNAWFEHGVIKGTFNFEIEIDDLRPFKGKGWTRDKFYDELVSLGKTPDVPDILDSDMAKARQAWQNRKKDGNDMNIVSSCTTELIKECVINKHRQHFLSKYKVGSTGWIVRGTGC